MCNIIVINKGEKEIETPRQFLAHFGFMVDKDIHHDHVYMDACLCQCDIEETFKENNIPFEKDCGDYYVTETNDVNKCPACKMDWEKDNDQFGCWSCGYVRK